VGDENEQRPLIGGFLSRFAGSGGNEEGTGRKEDEGGGVNLDGRASRFRRRVDGDMAPIQLRLCLVVGIWIWILGYRSTFVFI